MVVEPVHGTVCPALPELSADPIQGPFVAPCEEAYQGPDGLLTENEKRAVCNREADLDMPTRECIPYDREPALDDSEDEEEEDNAADPSSGQRSECPFLARAASFCVTCHRLTRRRFCHLRSSELRPPPSRSS
jgi:hypothetical protein